MIEYGIVVEDLRTGERQVDPVVYVDRGRAEDRIDAIIRQRRDQTEDFAVLLVQRRHPIFHGLDPYRPPLDHEALWNTLKAWAERGTERIDDVEAAHVLANMEALEAGEPIRE